MLINKKSYWLWLCLVGIAPESQILAGFGAQSDLLQNLGNMLNTPQGQDEFNSLAKGAMQDMFNDQQLLDQYPELRQLQESMQNDPSVFESYMDEVRNVMADPEISASLFNSLQNEFSDFNYDDQYYYDNYDDYLYDDWNYDDWNYDEWDQQDAASNQPQTATTSGYNPAATAATATPEVKLLSRVTLQGDWRNILLSRNADAAQRRAALREMVQNFSKTYKKLDRLRNRVDIFDDHLTQRNREQLQTLFYQTDGGLVDCAAALFTATGDEAAIQFFFDVFSTKNNFLEELSDFVLLLEEIAKVAKISAKQNVDKANGIALTEASVESELLVRLKNAQLFANRLASDLHTEFVKNPKLAETLEKQLTEAHGKQKKPLTQSSRASSYTPASSSSYNYGNSYGAAPTSSYYDYDNSPGYGSYGNDYGYDGYAGNNYYYDDYSGNNYYDDYYNNDYYDSPNYQSADSADRAPSDNTKSNAKDNVHVGTTSSADKSKLEAFVASCAELANAWPDIDANYFALLERFYTSTELQAANLEELLPQLKLKEKASQAIGGFSIAQASSDAATSTATASIGFSGSQLQQVLTAALKAQQGLTIKFAFKATDEQAQQDTTAVLQPPLPNRYFGAQGIFKGELQLLNNSNLEQQQFTAATTKMRSKLMQLEEFINTQHEFLQKVIAQVSSVTKLDQTQPLQKLQQSFARLEHEILAGMVMPTSSDLKELNSINFNNAETLKNPNLRAALQHCNATLQNLVTVAQEHKLFQPLPEMQPIKSRAQLTLQALQPLVAKLCNPQNPTSLLAMLTNLNHQILEYQKQKQQPQLQTTLTTPSLPAAEVLEFIKGFVASEKATTASQELGQSAAEFFKLLAQCSLLWEEAMPWQADLAQLQQVGAPMAQLSSAGTANAGNEPDFEQLANLMQQNQQGLAGIWNFVVNHPIITAIVGLASASGIAVTVWKIVDIIKSTFFKEAPPAAPGAQPASG